MEDCNPGHNAGKPPIELFWCWMLPLCAVALRHSPTRRIGGWLGIVESHVVGSSPIGVVTIGSGT